VNPGDWIAIASALVSALAVTVSAVAVYLTYRTGKEAREDAAKVAKEEREARAAEARAARVHAVRKKVYPKINEYVLRTVDITNRTDPPFTFEGDPGPPDWPDPEKLRRSNAAIYAAASRTMADKLMELRRSVEAFRIARLQWHASPPGTQAAELHANMETARRLVNERADDVLRLSGEELAE
jgi:capsid portal protein